MPAISPITSLAIVLSCASYDCPASRRAPPWHEESSGGDHAPNFQNRTLFLGDNLDILKGINSRSIHLIACDPPFNKGRDFHHAPDSLAGGGKFSDRWSWDLDVHPEWLDQIYENRPATWAVIQAARLSYGDDMAAYLCWLGVRLMELHRVLRDDGSIYMHFDHTAQAYAKALMDSIFGARNFRNEIVWCYEIGGRSKQRFANKHDVLLYYARSRLTRFNADDVRIPRKKTHMKIETDRLGRKWQVKRDAKTGKLYRYSADFGALCPDWWADIQQLNRSDAERTGFSTQKPLALYERIIKASSNPGDIVLDAFAGCATTLVAAEKLGRQWVGIDEWRGAHRVVVSRLRDLAVPGDGLRRKLTRRDVFYERSAPIRTDVQADEEEAPVLILREPTRIPKYQQLSNRDIKEILADAQKNWLSRQIICAGCGRGKDVTDTDLDHRTAKSAGGPRYITNRVILCRTCNGRKGNRLTLAGLWAENIKKREMHHEQRARDADEKARQRAREVRDELGR